MTTIRALTEKEIIELRKKIVCTESINKYYYDNWDVFYKKLTCKDDLPDEDWHPVTYYTRRKVEASNKGRIKLDGKVVEQKDYYEEKLGQNIVLNKMLLKGDSTKNKVGYLKVKGLGKLVYQMVANAWLGYEPDAGFIVHHLTNDGYDNRPENLVIVSENDHYNIHHKNGRYYRGNKKDDYKPL